MRIFLTIFICTFIIGCSSIPEKAEEHLKPGMTKAQVIELLGLPSSMTGTVFENSPNDMWRYWIEYPQITLFFDANGLFSNYTINNLYEKDKNIIQKVNSQDQSREGITQESIKQ